MVTDGEVEAGSFSVGGEAHLKKGPNRKAKRRRSHPLERLIGHYCHGRRSGYLPLFLSAFENTSPFYFSVIGPSLNSLRVANKLNVKVTKPRSAKSIAT